MAFEGAEKKFELVVQDVDLLGWADQHADDLVQACGARILKRLNNQHAQSYLLSESSLFVWPERLLMISCGQTRLVHSVIYALQNIDFKKLEALLFERKNEFFPTHQMTDFEGDAQHLNTELNKHQLHGQAWRFGYADEHHLHLYHMNKAYTPAPGEHTLELLMYNLPATDTSALANLFEDFQVSEHFFQPQGYSLNALRGDEYYTVHLSPEPDNPYISFESNMRSPAPQSVVQRVLDVLSPASFDFIYFSPKGKVTPALKLPHFTPRSRFAQNLDCGFHICYEHWFAPSQSAQKGQSLNTLIR